MDRELGQPRALLVLRQRLDPQPPVERAQVDLDRVDAEVDLGRDLRVRGRRRVRVVAQRPAQRDQHVVLRRRDREARLSSAGAKVVSPSVISGARNATSVLPKRSWSPSLRRWRPRTRSSLRNVPFVERPSSETVHAPPTCSQLRMRARDLAIPRQAQVGGRPAADGDPLCAPAGSARMRWWPSPSRYTSSARAVLLRVEPFLQLRGGGRMAV